MPCCHWSDDAPRLKIALISASELENDWDVLLEPWVKRKCHNNPPPMLNAVSLNQLLSDVQRYQFFLNLKNRYRIHRYFHTTNQTIISLVLIYQTFNCTILLKFRQMFQDFFEHATKFTVSHFARSDPAKTFTFLFRDVNNHSYCDYCAFFSRLCQKFTNQNSGDRFLVRSFNDSPLILTSVIKFFRRNDRLVCGQILTFSRATTR